MFHRVCRLSEKRHRICFPASGGGRLPPAFARWRGPRPSTAPATSRGRNLVPLDQQPANGSIRLPVAAGIGQAQQPPIGQADARGALHLHHETTRCRRARRAAAWRPPRRPRSRWLHALHRGKRPSAIRRALASPAGKEAGVLSGVSVTRSDGRQDRSEKAALRVSEPATTGS